MLFRSDQGSKISQERPTAAETAPEGWRPRLAVPGAGGVGAPGAETPRGLAEGPPIGPGSLDRQVTPPLLKRGNVQPSPPSPPETPPASLPTARALDPDADRTATAPSPGHGGKRARVRARQGAEWGLHSVVSHSLGLYVAHEAPLSTGLLRQDCCSGLPCPPLGGLPNPGTEPLPLMSPAPATSAAWATPPFLEICSFWTLLINGMHEIGRAHVLNSSYTLASRMPSSA